MYEYTHVQNQLIHAKIKYCIILLKNYNVTVHINYIVLSLYINKTYKTKWRLQTNLKLLSLQYIYYLSTHTLQLYTTVYRTDIFYSLLYSIIHFHDASADCNLYNDFYDVLSYSSMPLLITSTWENRIVINNIHHWTNWMGCNIMDSIVFSLRICTVYQHNKR